MNDERNKDEVALTGSTIEDLTDEYPALDMGSIGLADNGDDDEEPNANDFAVHSLNKLEGDIHNLQARWSAVESDICTRDAEIEELKHQLSIKQSDLTQLQNELDLAHEDNRGLTEKLESERASTTEVKASTGTLEQKSNELKEKIQDLEAYIDRRKEDWQKLQNDVAAYESTILGMEKIVREKDELIALHQRETVEASESLIDLEQQYAELDGRRAERELANQELQDKLVTASQDVERLSRESEKLRAEVDRITAELTDRHAAELEAIKTEHDTASEARSEKLQNQQDRINEVISSLEDERKRADTASSEIARNEKELAAERDRTAELENALEQSADKLASAERELAARDQLVSALRSDLQGQKDSIEILDRNVQRLNELGTYVKTLDDRISSQVGEHTDDKSEVKTKIRDGSDTPCIVSTETDQPIKYPLYKSDMIIGRSSDADIQLRWKFISREHARILLDGPAATIEDLGSKNGIYVNNESIVRQELHDGDRLEIGELQFTFISAMH